MLILRIITAAVLAGLFIPALFLTSMGVWIALCLLIIWGCAWEWTALSGLKDRKYRVLFASVVAGLTAIVAIAGWRGDLWYVSAVAFWSAAVPWLLMRHRLPENAWFKLASGVIVLVSAGLALGELRSADPSLLLLLMAIVWISDSFAFFTGRAFGRRKLAPAISPGKTWEGVYGALAAVLVYAIICLVFFEKIIVPVWLAQQGAVAWVAAFWLLLAVAGIVGDLMESLLKRTAGVKDSGAVLPGHGGMLDRVDGLLPILPAAALFYLR